MIQVHLGRSLVLVASALCVALNVYPEPVSAQEAYPSKPIHFLVTTAAGGAGDLVARALADRMSAELLFPEVSDSVKCARSTQISVSPCV